MTIMRPNRTPGRHWVGIPLLLFVAGCGMLSPHVPTPADPSASVRQHNPLGSVESRDKPLYHYSRYRLLVAEQNWPAALDALRQALAADPQTPYLHLVLARFYLHREQPDAAQETLLAMLERFPDHPQGHELLGDIFSHQQEYVQAGRHYRRALEQNPEDEALLMRLALVLERQEQTGEAIAVLEELLAAHPQATFAQLSLARFYLQQGDQEHARSTYEAILSRDPDLPQAIIEYGSLLAGDDPRAARQLYLEALSRQPAAHQVRSQLARHYLTVNEPRLALGQFQYLQQQFPEDRSLRRQVALLQIELQDWAPAAEAFRRLLIDPDQQQGQDRYYLAIALAGQQQLDEALKVLQRITRESPLYAESLLQRGYLHQRQGQTDEALRVLRQGLAEGFDNPELYYYLVAFLGERGQPDEALAIAREGVQVHPEDTRLLYQLGILHENRGERTSAVAVMEKVLELDNAHSEALNFLAYHQAEAEIDLSLALNRARRALALQPSGYIADTLGWVYYKLGRFEESREQLEKATQLHPEDQIILEHLGDLYRAMELWGKAAETYRRVLDIDPAADGVQKKLDSLPGAEGMDP